LIKIIIKFFSIGIASSGSLSGEYDLFKFEGDFDLQVQLTGINTISAVNLPAACKNPVSP
jgi:hypothetical protein